METLKLKFYRGSDAPEGIILIETTNRDLALVRCRRETTGAAFFPVLGGKHLREQDIIGWSSNLSFQLWENDRKKPDEFADYRGKPHEVQGYRYAPPQDVPLLIKVAEDGCGYSSPVPDYYPSGSFPSHGRVVLGYFDGTAYHSMFSQWPLKEVLCWRQFEVTPVYEPETVAAS